MREALALAERVLPHDTSVLLLGETGTGKDRLAQALHSGGARRAAAFVRIDCAALPIDLFEAEVFGYEKGAFTDARQRKIGRFESASGGSIYLDEISELDPAAQAKLLRVLEQRRISRLGGTAEIPIDVRLIASTSADPDRLRQAVRSDLLYRLDVFSIQLPPLRERRDDLPMLARRILRELGSRARISEEAMALLLEHDWPGNVRELKNVLERAAVVAGSGEIDAAHLPGTVRSDDSLLTRAVRQMWTLEQLEAEYIRRILDTTGGNASRAAEILGIHRKTLLEKRRRSGRGQTEEGR